jgi:hypothetical protein
MPICLRLRHPTGPRFLSSLPFKKFQKYQGIDDSMDRNQLKQTLEREEK